MTPISSMPTSYSTVGPCVASRHTFHPHTQKSYSWLEQACSSKSAIRAWNARHRCNGGWPHPNRRGGSLASAERDTRGDRDPGSGERGDL